MAYKSKCTPCFRSSFHIARRKQASYPGGRDGVQYANARLSGLVFHRSHCHIDMAYNALEYIFAALLDAPLDVVLVGMDQGALGDGFLDDGLDRRLLDIGQH